MKSITAKMICFFIIFCSILSLFLFSCSDDPTGPVTPKNYKIAFVHENNSNQDIYIINPDGNGLTQLTDSEENDSDPIWSPDGRYIYYKAIVNSSPEIFRMDIDGSNKINITNNDDWDYLCDISPDGKKLLFMSNRDGNGNNLYIVDLATDSVTQLTHETSADFVYAMFGSDNQNIYFTISNIMSSDIYKLRIGDSTYTKLTNSHICTDPNISPNGLRILYKSTDIDTHNTDVCICDTDGTNNINYSFSSNDCHDPCWSPDGLKLIYAETINAVGTFVMQMNADGTARVAITDTISYITNLAWSPDGSKIAYEYYGDGNAEIYIMNTDGSNPIKLTDDGDRNKNPVWSPAL